MNEQDFTKTFEACKYEFPDDGFSERVIKHLPERKSIFPQIVMAAFVLLSLVIMFLIQDFTPILEQINSLINAMSQLKIPSASAIMVYFSVLGLIGLIGYSVVQADVG
jgi:hypothetical protein